MSVSALISKADLRRLAETSYINKMMPVLSQETGYFPHVTRDGKWLFTEDGGWTGGFWAGQVWLLWHLMSESRLRVALGPIQYALVERKDEPEADFDLGFLYTYTYILGHRLTGEAVYARIAMDAASRLVKMAHPENGMIFHRYPERTERYGDGTVSTIIDVMMNLQLLWWAHGATGNALYKDAAMRHAVRTREWLLRDDGSIAQLADFDAVTGALIRRDTRQGAAADSCWSRGQAWGIYGFLLAAIATGSADFHDAFRRALDFWAAHLPDDGVPAWDFAAAAKDAPKDSSAAAIVLAALRRAEDAGCAPDIAGGLAKRMFDGLSAHLLPDGVDGALGAGCLNFPAGRGVNAATVWGDYYFLEALVGATPY